MLGALDADRTTVRRLRVRCDADARGAERDAARARLGLTLAASALRPPSLPASAVLCVRRLADPLPGRLGARAGGRPPAEWEHAARERLTRLWHDAARPALGPVSAGAESVLFADRGELLACLAADGADGLLHARWWWSGERIVSGGAPSVAGMSPVARAWVERAESVPAALACLAATGRAARVAAAFAPGEARAVADAVALRFAVRLYAPSAAHTPPPDAASSDGGGRPARDGAGPTPNGTAPAPPWRPLAPEADDPALGPEQRRLLGVALVLHRAPHVARETCFAASLRDWERARATRADGVAEDAPRPDAESSTAPPHAAAREVAPGGPTAPDPAPRPATSPPSTPTGDRVDTRGHAAPVHAPATAPAYGGPTTRLAPGEPGRARVVATEPVRHAAIDTALGGTFYLVNVALALGLYGDFTAPARPGLPLPPWDFLALAGRALVGPAFDADPLPALLARLAGRRERERPGARFRPDDAWRVPPEWLAAFPERDGWTWSAARGRLTVRHPAGFLAVDVPREERVDHRCARMCTDGSSTRGGRHLCTSVHICGEHARHICGENSRDDQLSRELAALGCPDVAPHRRAHRADRRGAPAERWMRRLAPYLRARLRRALGVGDDVDVGALVCAHAARVRVSPERVDVELALADLPIALRLAGLDRDPGWVPAAGRAIAFHFE